MYKQTINPGTTLLFVCPGMFFLLKTESVIHNCGMTEIYFCPIFYSFHAQKGQKWLLFPPNILSPI